MKLSHISINNFLGIREIELDLSSPVTLIAGMNGAGKSSLRDSIALAMSGVPTRVTKKGDYAKLITNGQKKGNIALQFADGRSATVSLPDGEVVRNGHDEGEASDAMRLALPYVLDAARFGTASADERRALLFAVTGCRINGDEITRRLTKRGASKERIDEVLPMLRSGFPAGADYAAGKARDEKAAWRTVTGEAWGAKKAEDWQAECAALDGGELPGLEAELADVDVRYEAAVIAYGAEQERAIKRQRDRQQITALREAADLLPRRKAKLATDKNELAKWRTELQRLENAQLSQEALPCPCCGTMLVRRGDALIEAGLLAQGATDDDIAQLPQARASVTLYENAVRNSQRDVLAAEQAAQQLAELEAGENDAGSTEDLDAKEKAATELRQQRQQLLDAITAAREQLAKAEAAERRTADAATHHTAVNAWLLISEALSPDGIPGEIVADALKPFNQAVRGRCIAASWGDNAPAMLAPDMGLLFDGRPYALLSESERWRVDCVTALAIAELSGLRFAMLDRFDVLDTPSRVQMVQMLADLVESERLDTVIVLGTMKKAPAGLPAGIAAHWIENGRLQFA